MDSEGSSGDIQKFIDPNDFKSMEICIGVINSTARTEVKNFELVTTAKSALLIKEKVTRRKINDDLQLLEFQEQGVVLHLPLNSCSVGHHLILDFEISQFNSTLRFETTAKVKAVELLGDAQWVQLQFIQFEEKDWDAFKNLYNSRQNQILEFFEATKG